MFEPVYKKLNAIDEIKGKVYYASALKNAVAPFCVWIQTDEGETEALDGNTGLQASVFELDVVSKKLSELESISQKVKAAVISLRGETESGIIFEDISIEMGNSTFMYADAGLYMKTYLVTINFQNGGN